MIPEGWWEKKKLRIFTSHRQFDRELGYTTHETSIEIGLSQTHLRTWWMGFEVLTKIIALLDVPLSTSNWTYYWVVNLGDCHQYLLFTWESAEKIYMPLALLSVNGYLYRYC